MPLFQKQQEALEVSKGKKGFGFFMGMGSGKTLTLLTRLNELFVSGEIDYCIIVSPLGVYREWLKQANCFFPEYTDEFLTLESLTPKKIDSFAGKPFRFYTINYDALSSATSPKKEFISNLLKRNRGRGAIVLDESHRIKTPNSKVTYYLLSCRKLAKYKFILTGTPLANQYIDLYAQFKFLDDSIMPPNLTIFKARYCVLNIFNKVVKYVDVDDLLSRIKPHYYYCSTRDCVDLPAFNSIVKYVEMTPKQARLYKELKDDLFTELEPEKFLILPNKQAVINKALQILSGFAYFKDIQNPDTPSAPVEIPNNRIKTLCDLLDALEGNIVLWVSYRHDFTILKEILKNRELIVIEASTPKEDRWLGLSQFCKDGKKGNKILLSSPAILSTGFDGLQNASNTMIYYNNTFNLINRQQSIARLFRNGQKDKVLQIDLCVKDTLDEVVLQSLNKKAKMQQTIN